MNPIILILILSSSNNVGRRMRMDGDFRIILGSRMFMSINSRRVGTGGGMAVAWGYGDIFAVAGVIMRLFHIWRCSIPVGMRMLENRNYDTFSAIMGMVRRLMHLGVIIIVRSTRRMTMRMGGNRGNIIVRMRMDSDGKAITDNARESM
jgi:hypothetical protein